jgi:hypothetical protein
MPTSFAAGSPTGAMQMTATAKFAPDYQMHVIAGAKRREHRVRAVVVLNHFNLHRIED